MQPKDTTTNDAFMFFQNKECPFWMCHEGIDEDKFSCLFCYCPLVWLECKGPYLVFEDKNGIKRKDCSACTLVHNDKKRSWKFIQKALAHPVIWQGQEQIPKILKRFGVTSESSI